MGKYIINNNDYYICECMNFLMYYVFYINRDFFIIVKGFIKFNDVGGVVIV